MAINDRMAIINDYAWQLAEAQVNAIELNARRDAEQHAEMADAVRDMDAAREALDERLKNMDIIDRYSSACMRYAGTLAMEAYLCGLSDGIRLAIGQKESQ